MATPALLPPLLCVLCINPAQDDFPLFGDEMPPVRLCRQCHHKVGNDEASVGWCELGQHYGRPRTHCQRHHIQFALASQTDIPAS
ncbi:hypothetical protein ACL02T_29790 [Pseudonocardia sp. RS010]|uniref:hypothetical protein n=1 Tax=Pseudonocardia sp. RS010 TaxID=3385979 RepID=UPI00399FA672